MALFQQNNDWLQQDDQAIKLRSSNTFTVSCWLKPEAGGTAVFPFAFVFSDDLAAPTQQLALFATGGFWFVLYTYSGGSEVQIVAVQSSDWRFISLTFTPGTTPGTTAVRSLVRLATNATPGAWETDLTHDNLLPILNDGWAVHTLSTGQDAATFGYYGHLQHWKAWDVALTPEQLWRESQLALPAVTGGLLAWNPVQVETDALYAQQQGSASGGGYTFPSNAPIEETSHAPLPTRPTPGAVFLNAPSPNPTLTHGTLALEGTSNLQGRLGFAGRLCTGVVAFVGGLLVVAGASNPSLGGGVFGLVGALLSATVGAGNPSLAGGGLIFDGAPLAAVAGPSAALNTGQLILFGTLPAAAAGQGAAIDEGAVLCRGEAMTGVLGLAGALAAGDFVLASEGLRATSLAPPDIVQGFEATVAEDQPVVTADVGGVAAAAPTNPVVVVDAGPVTATVDSADVVASTDDPPSVNVSC